MAGQACPSLQAQAHACLCTSPSCALASLESAPHLPEMRVMGHRADGKGREEQ